MKINPRKKILASHGTARQQKVLGKAGADFHLRNSARKPTYIVAIIECLVAGIFAAYYEAQGCCGEGWAWQVIAHFGNFFGMFFASFGKDEGGRRKTAAGP